MTLYKIWLYFYVPKNQNFIGDDVIHTIVCGIPIKFGIFVKHNYIKTARVSC
jgi:hypothetical protein